MGLRYAAIPALLVIGVQLVPAAGIPASAKPAGKKGAASGNFERDISPLLKKYCLSCHSGKEPVAGISLADLVDESSLRKNRSMWERVSQNVSNGHMPPKMAAQPTGAERSGFVTWVDTRLSTVDCSVKDPGRVTLRRLNRAEYNNTIRDLVGVDFHPADDFPSDDVGYGFDNIGDVLSMSPLLMEKYLSAAEKIAGAAIVVPEGNRPFGHVDLINVPDSAGGHFYNNYGRILGTNGEIATRITFPKEGDYLVRVKGFGQQAGTEPARMTIRLDGKDVQTVDVPATEDHPGVYEVKVHAPAARLKVAAAFINDYYEEKNPDPKKRDRNLVLESIEAVGPLGEKPPVPSEMQKRIFIAEPTANTHEARVQAARTILEKFATRAYRRPVTGAELGRLLKYVDLAEKEGDPFERGIQLAVEAVLTSPNFLFRVELDAPAAAGSGSASPATHPVNEWELASRLSYFLWSSMPDDELFQLASTGKLHEKKVLEAQVRRMIRDPKSHQLVENFGDQWLTLRNLQNVNPDPKQFPDFNDQLRAAMLKETELFFEAVMREDRPVLDFLDANYTFLNERLAKHYGIDWVKGDQFRRVVLKDPNRGGVLTQASILTVTSNPTRTSPVKRGKWVLEQMLGTPPPPPPPNVPELKTGGMLTGTLRQRMEQHRKDPMCASCHGRMDPLGFGLENFDAVGAWRSQDGGQPIDSSGVLPDGRKFDGAKGLKGILLKQKDLFTHNLTEKMLTFAIGRGLEYYDKCAVDEIERRVAKNKYRFSTLVTEIVASDPFLKRRGEGEEK